jgi:hypothetical protein
VELLGSARDSPQRCGHRSRRRRQRRPGGDIATVTSSLRRGAREVRREVTEVMMWFIWADGDQRQGIAVAVRALSAWPWRGRALREQRGSEARGNAEWSTASALELSTSTQAKARRGHAEGMQRSWRRSSGAWPPHPSLRGHLSSTWRASVRPY